MRRGIVTACSVLTCVLSACHRKPEQAIPDGYVARRVEEARRHGQRFATIGVTSERGGTDLVPLAHALRMHSVMWTEATGRSVVALHPDFIRTWHVFRYIETISRATEKDWCGLTLPESVTLADNEVAFPLAQGSMMLRGIRLMMDTSVSDVSFRPGQQFLVFATPCVNRAYTFGFGIKSLFELTKDQHFRIDLPDSDIPQFARELRLVGSVENLRRNEQKLKQFTR